jgi:hypothetical protein
MKKKKYEEAKNCPLYVGVRLTPQHQQLASFKSKKEEKL